MSRQLGAMRSCLWHSQANLQETASTSVARPPEAGLQSPDYSVTRPLLLALVLVDEDGQVHVQLVNVVGQFVRLRSIHPNDQFVRLRSIHPLVVGARGSRGRDEIDVAFRHGPERMKRMASGANAGRALWRAEYGVPQELADATYA